MKIDKKTEEEKCLSVALKICNCIDRNKLTNKEALIAIEKVKNYYINRKVLS